MASYEEDHNITKEEKPKQAAARPSRDDPALAAFFSNDPISPSESNLHSLADALRNYQMNADVSSPLLNQMISLLSSNSLTSDPKSSTLPPDFPDTLPRVPKSRLKPDDACPICTLPHLSDKYPLVVELRCNHRFDLECIVPWFRVSDTCPMCRGRVVKEREVVAEDSEEEFDDTYG
ncbi:hypothetical protein SAICODRAFT_30702 [Saitoella complicata NRRL Y-17804]|nr:uncharacterized protein SAICODRAFT_30702 [Saitoella complicata NRRL Y-17804]ODQ52598.1 hypothetical protein SAICODRAFT_30702 [Saitoella complicata NRRL Y-17804]